MSSSVLSLHSPLYTGNARRVRDCPSRCLHIFNELTPSLDDTGKAASLEPWFPAHLQRDIYFSLLHIDPSSQSEEKKISAVPESVLKAALLRRATEDIRRVLALRSQKQALSMLLQRGSVGDDLWQRFSRAEKEMEEEVKDVVSEVSRFLSFFFSLSGSLSGSANLAGFSQSFFPSRQTHMSPAGARPFSSPRTK